MELIVINENKLKIMMNKSDMSTYGLDENEFHCSLTNTRSILERILHNSPIRTGFENISFDDRILMQLYPDKNGGCELYVTKISLDEKEDAFAMPRENEERYLLPKATPKKQSIKQSLISYRFEGLEHVIKAAKELLIRNFSGECALYHNDDGKYYLFVNSKSQDYDEKANIDFLSEFGELTNAENSYLLLLEHGKCIFKDEAIKHLSEI